MIASRFLNPRNALVFRRVFGSERNKDILIHFLNDILVPQAPIEGVTFLKTVQDPAIAPLRVSLVDVLCEDRNKNRFIIEMQVSHERGFDRRALYYAARAYCSQRTRNHKFHDLKDVYFLAITDFAPFPKKKEWLSRIGLKDLKTGEHDIGAIQLLFMQLPLFKKNKAHLKNMTLCEKWAYFFKYADETTEADLEKLVGEDQIIKKAYEALNRFGWSEKELNYYESIEMKIAANEAVREAAFEKGHFTGHAKGHAEGRAEGCAEGRAEGDAEGRAQERMEIARLLIKQELPPRQIAQATGLSLEAIQDLKD